MMPNNNNETGRRMSDGSIEQRVMTLEFLVSNLTAKSSQLEEAVANLDTTLDRMRIELTQLSEGFKHVDASVSGMHNQMSELIIQLSAVNSNLTELKGVKLGVIMVFTSVVAVGAAVGGFLGWAKEFIK
jgi:uncharacterized coiled-coil protein SlyX